MSQTGITLPTSKYSFTFMYKLTGTHPQWTNVFHITNTDRADGGFQGRNPSLWITPSGIDFHLRFTTSDGNWNNGFDSVPNIPLNTEALISFVFNNDTVSMYINNNLLTSKTFSGINKILSNATLYIANPNEPTGHARVQDFTIHDGPLTSNEITKIFNNSKPNSRSVKTESDRIRQLIMKR